MNTESRAYINRSEMNILFVHSELDDSGLSPAEFRVYCHLARRANNTTAFPGIDSMAKICGLSKPTVIKSIKELEGRGMVVADRHTGMTTRYTLTALSSWNQSNPDNATGKKEVTKGNPTKVIQLRNKVVMPEIPKELAGEDFEKCWEAWLADRADRRKKVTPRAATMQLEKLRLAGKEEAVRCIREAIEKGWQGLFPNIPYAQKQQEKDKHVVPGPYDTWGKPY